MEARRKGREIEGEEKERVCGKDSHYLEYDGFYQF